jgi:hypothetical protein
MHSQFNAFDFPCVHRFRSEHHEYALHESEPKLLISRSRSVHSESRSAVLPDHSREKLAFSLLKRSRILKPMQMERLSQSTRMSLGR